MVEEVAFDPIQVHSPGWRPLARRALAQLPAGSMVREEADGLVFRYRVAGLTPSRRRMLTRLVAAYRAAAGQTCQICSLRASGVHPVPGTNLHLCPWHHWLLRADGRRLPWRTAVAPDSDHRVDAG